jgi:hypothetical protein
VHDAFRLDTADVAVEREVGTAYRARRSTTAANSSSSISGTLYAA